MRTRPSPLTLLKSRDAAPGLCLPSSPAFKAGTIAARHLNTTSFAVLTEALAENDLLVYLRQVLFGTGLDLVFWPQLIENSEDLASLPPDLLADRASIKSVRGADLISRSEIQTHCVALFAYSQRNSTYCAETLKSVLTRSPDVSLGRHAMSLHELRHKHAELAIATLEDRIVDALELVRLIASDGQRAIIIRTIMRHWLLYRRFHLQRGVAYVASYRRAALPFLLPLTGLCDAAATTAATYAEVLGGAASSCSAGYLRSRRTGGKAGNPGRTALPFEFVRAIVDQRGVRPALEYKSVYEGILDQQLPILLDKMPGIFQIVADRMNDGIVIKNRLYAAACLPRSSRKALTIFEIGHTGLSPAAMVLMTASRYAEAVAIAEAVIDNPALAWSGSATIPTRRQSDADVVNHARDAFDTVRGGAAISLGNTTKPLKLAKTFLRLHLQYALVSQTLEGQLLAAFDPLFAAHWLAMCPPAPVG